MSERRLLFATTNRAKIQEVGEILTGIPFELVTLADFPDVVPPEETGRTFAENARDKALAYARAIAAPVFGVVAEDSGLEIDALNGAPGVESARFGGVGVSYPEKFALIYDALRARRATASTARFVCAVALVANNRVIFEAEGKIEGHIAPEPKGRGGFGYDPIFYYPPYGCTLAEAADRKSAVSHRGEAFRRLRRMLTEGRGLGG